MVLNNVNLFNIHKKYLQVTYILLAIFCMMNNILINIFLKVKRTLKQFSINKYILYLIIVY